MTKHERELIRLIREIEANWSSGDLAQAVRAAAKYADTVELWSRAGGRSAKEGAL